MVTRHGTRLILNAPFKIINLSLAWSFALVTVDSRRESYTCHEDSVCLGKANNLILLHATKLSKLKKGCEPPSNLTLKGKKKTMRNLLPPASLALIRFMCVVFCHFWASLIPAFQLKWWMLASKRPVGKRIDTELVPLQPIEFLWR